MQIRQFKWFILLLAQMLLLSGCTIPTSRTTFTVADQEEATKTPVDARVMLAKAVQTTTEADESAQFWYTGYIKNSIGEQKTTSMYEGIVIRPMEAYIVNGRIAGQPFNYYRWEDKHYIKRGSVWFRANSEDVLDFDPFRGFLDWMPLMQNASQLPDQEILGEPCEVVQVRTSGKEWVEKADSPLFKELKQKIKSKESLNHILENTVVKSTIWIGKKDGYLYQYSTWIVMPLPGAGYFDQETFFRFYKYGDPGIVREVKPPEEVEKWVVQFEEKIKSGDYEDEPQPEEMDSKE